MERVGQGESGPVFREENAGGAEMLPAARWRVVLPGGLPRQIDVYVNGVPQRPDDDYVRDADGLLFARPLAREGRLGFWRWLSLFLGVAGTYRQDDSVDVVYELNGVRTVASGLEIVPPPG